MKLVAFASLLLTFSVFANNTIDYVELEKKSSDIVCKKNPDCIPYKPIENKEASGPFIVDGVTLPSNALRDKEQQADMIAASLYVTIDGDVIALPDEGEMIANAEKALEENEKRQKVRPIKTFPAPVITSSNKKVIIKVK